VFIIDISDIFVKTLFHKIIKRIRNDDDDDDDDDGDG